MTIWLFSLELEHEKSDGQTYRPNRLYKHFSNEIKSVKTNKTQNFDLKKDKFLFFLFKTTYVLPNNVFKEEISCKKGRMSFLKYKVYLNAFSINCS